MGLEIERKFLVKRTDFLKDIKGEKYTQAYLNIRNERTVRLRIAGNKAYLTIKGRSEGMTRKEYEYDIPLKDAREMIDALCEKPAIEKIRYKVDHEGFTWEVDVFQGENEGLVVAEIELDDESRLFPRPDWLGEEVTHDRRYRNSSLVTNPYLCWRI